LRPHNAEFSGGRSPSNVAQRSDAATICYIFGVVLKMKDKIARDKAVIVGLRKDLESKTATNFALNDMCRKLITLAKKHGAESHEIFEIIQDDHFLRKQI
jgi:hypothetical protein